MWDQFQLSEFRVADFDSGVVGIGVQLGADKQAGFRRRAADQIDDRLMAEQRLAAPVLGDEAEETMLDLVPFARARREVAHADVETGTIGQFLQFPLPKPVPWPIASSRIGSDHQRRCFWVCTAAHRLPPTPDALNGE